LQQNQRRTERIESATTPLTTPTMIGVAEVIEEECGVRVGEVVAEAAS
jgi:hypothetical protein